MFILVLNGCAASVSFDEIELNPENLAQPSGIEGRWIIITKNEKDTSALVRATDAGTYELLFFNADKKSVIFPLALINKSPEHNFIALFRDPDKPDDSSYTAIGLLEKKSKNTWVFYYLSEKNRQTSRDKWVKWMNTHYGLAHKELGYSKDSVAIKGADTKILRTILQDPRWKEYIVNKPMAKITKMPGDHVDQVEFDKALAKSGDAAAQYILGNRYFSGNGVKKNSSNAVEWYHRAAEQGHAVSQFIIGTMYLKGNGVAKNTGLAIQWLEKAALQGNDGAKKMLKLAREMLIIDRKLAINAQKHREIEKTLEALCSPRQCSRLEGRIIYRSRVTPHWWYWPDGSVVRRENWPDE